MPVLPGGKIIGGMGGRIWMFPNTRNITPLAVSTFRDLDGLDPGDANTNGSTANIPYYLDVLQWSISRTLILAEIPHSGCVGGVTRRVIGQTWRWSASLPLDQSNFPDNKFDIGVLDEATESGIVGDVAIAFYLGDVKLNPEAVYMGMDMEQSLYYSPRTAIHQVNPVLNAAGDVIRYSISGEEICRLFLIPSELDACDRYATYLDKHKGWL